MPAPPAVELTRQQEFAYIRSDLRRLFVIAGGLLAVMLILLVVVNGLTLPSTKLSGRGHLAAPAYVRHVIE